MNYLLSVKWVKMCYKCGCSDIEIDEQGYEYCQNCKNRI